MVALMILTKNLYRFLWPGSDSNDQDEEHMETNASPDQVQDTLPQEVVLSGEEGLSKEERDKRRAERRRAKRKRQRQKKKLEKVKKSEDEDEDEEEDGGVESELDESEGEDQAGEEEQKSPASPPPSSKAPPLASGNRANRQPAAACEEEPWDVGSAFVANVVKAKTKGGRQSKENKENESRGRETNDSDNRVQTKKSALLAVERGIRLVQERKYSQAVIMFTEAIKYDSSDYRFFGNRSYCHECLEEYPLALSDAETAIRLAPEWPKGYYRQGSALMGMKRYSEAEKAMEKVLQLDKECEEAATELFNCKVLQLMDLGFDEMQSVSLLEKFTSVQEVLESPEASAVLNQDSFGGPYPSLWVGNVTTELTEKHLFDLFKMYGEIESIRVLHERFCAFVNFKKANMASLALEKLNGFSIENTRLVVRYPDRRVHRPTPIPARISSTLPQTPAAYGSRRRGPVNGDECYFWRTTGCHFGDKCRYKHIPDHKGKDRKPWQP
ncbi:tetratricopeptide repeat protein 31 [Denticeps clupeoides]|uniref:Uncharacterized protein n=1 Tax=Denticeps clupeoides TaxID=299321 RepID=A0AAY3ZVT0_9TELE|nr:tetratricopeptide repeat protein 31-like [Denticeps clupeoides]